MCNACCACVLRAIRVSCACAARVIEPPSISFLQKRRVSSMRAGAFSL